MCWKASCLALAILLPQPASAQLSDRGIEDCAAVAETEPDCIFELAKSLAAPENSDIVMIGHILKQAEPRPVAFATRGSLDKRSYMLAAQGKIDELMRSMTDEEMGRSVMMVDFWPVTLIATGMYDLAEDFLLKRDRSLNEIQRDLFAVGKMIEQEPALAAERLLSILRAARESMPEHERSRSLGTLVVRSIWAGMLLNLEKELIAADRPEALASLHEGLSEGGNLYGRGTVESRQLRPSAEFLAAYAAAVRSEVLSAAAMKRREVVAARSAFLAVNNEIKKAVDEGRYAHGKAVCARSRDVMDGCQFSLFQYELERLAKAGDETVMRGFLATEMELVDVSDRGGLVRCVNILLGGGFEEISEEFFRKLLGNSYSQLISNFEYNEKFRSSDQIDYFDALYTAGFGEAVRRAARFGGAEAMTFVYLYVRAAHRSKR